MRFTFMVTSRSQEFLHTKAMGNNFLRNDRCGIKNEEVGGYMRTLIMSVRKR